MISTITTSELREQCERIIGAMAPEDIDENDVTLAIVRAVPTLLDELCQHESEIAQLKCLTRSALARIDNLETDGK